MKDGNKMYQAALVYIERLNNRDQGKIILERLLEEYPERESAPGAQQWLKQIN